MSETTPKSNEFQDPLENYEPKTYDDPLEQALVDEELGEIRHEPFKTISPETTIEDALKCLAGLHIACLMITDKGKLVGVLSERDVLSKVAFEFDDLKGAPVSQVMTKEPIYVYENDSAVSALSVMAICGYRHVPVLDVNDNVVGIISPQRVTEFLQNHFE